jgi:hypothetical protein
MAFSPRHLTASDLFVRWLPLLAFIAVIANHLWFVYSHAINIPYQDGIYDYLRFVQLAEAADGAKGVFAELFKQYMFHRTSAPRLFVYAAYLIEGEVNFHTLTILANLVVALILLLFYLSVRGEKYRWIWLLVSALLLLHLRSYTIVLWSQPAFPYYSVFFFAFAGLFALHKVTVPKLLLAGILCTFSAFSYASGQIVWLLGLASLLHQCLISGRRSLMYPAIWLLIAIAVLILWRVDYTGSTFTGGTAYLGLNLNLLMLPDQLYDAPLHQVLARYAAFFLVMLGSAFTDSSVWGAGAAGLIVLAMLSFISIRFIKQEDIRLALCCWFVVASATAVTAGRAIWLSPDYILDTRYSFLSVILISTLALLVQTKFKLFKTPLVYLVIPLAGIYWIWAHRHFEGPLQDLMNERYKAYNNERYPVFGRASTEPAAIVKEAISTGLYKPPCRLFPECEASSKSGE